MDYIEHMNTTLDGVDQGMFVTSIKELFSFKARLFDGYFDMSQMLLLYHSVYCDMYCSADSCLFKNI